MKRPALFAAALALSWAVAAGASPLPYPATHGTWYEVSTSRFRVYSDAGVAQATRAARHLERLAEAMEKTRAGLRVDSTRKVCVYAFRDAESFRPYVENAGDDYGTTVGYQLAGCDVDYLMYFVVPGNRSLAFASHEFTHAAVARTLGRMPVWASEGLAEYFSTFESRAKRAQIGRPVLNSRRRLRDHVQPLESFLLVGQNSPEYSHGPNRALIYAQSWELVHMLMLDDERGPARFDDLLRLLAGGTPGAEALAQVYGPGAVDSLERQLRRKVAETSVTYMNYDFDSAFVTVPVRARALGRAETQLVLGELLAHSFESQLPSAEEHLLAAWNADSSQLRAAALLAHVAERRGRSADAERWARVVERAPGADARAAGIAADAMARRWRRRRETLAWPAAGPAPGEALAKTLYERALALEPLNDSWLAGYAMACFDDTADVSRAREALTRAQGSWPPRCDLAGAQSILAMRAGDRAAAVRWYQQIPRGDERIFWRGQAGTLIANAAFRESGEHVRAGRVSEAESLLVRLRRDVAEPGVARICDERLQAIREQRALPEAAASGDPVRANNERRIRLATEWIARNWKRDACALLDLVLTDEAPADLKLEAQRLQAEFCDSPGE